MHKIKRATRKMDDSLNLDIATYSLNDLYALFHIPPDQMLTEPVLKQSKKMVLQTHPDKSRLDAKFFLFFSKAYKVLFSLYSSNSTHQNHQTNQNNQTNKTNENVQYTSLLETNHDKDEETYLSRFFNKNPQLKKDATKFNTWFNREFVQCSDLMYDTEKGHGEWLKSDSEIPTDAVTKETFQAYKTQRINNSNALINGEPQEIQAFQNNQGINSNLSMLGDPNQNQSVNQTMNYGSDLKHVYSETVLPVNESMMQSHVHSSVQSYQHGRDRQDTTPISEQDAKQVLNTERRQTERDGMNRSFYYANQSEQSYQKKQLFWSKMKQIK